VGSTGHNRSQPHDPAGGRHPPRNCNKKSQAPQPHNPPEEKFPNLQPSVGDPSASIFCVLLLRHLPPSPMDGSSSEVETTEAQRRHLQAKRHKRQLFERRRGFEASRRWLQAARRPRGGYQAAMGRAVTFLGPYPDKDAEMAFALDLPRPARCAAAAAVEGSVTGGAAARLTAHSGVAAVTPQVFIKNKYLI
jgi:hypothetical protein